MYLDSKKKSECSGCKACGYVCPVQAISFNYDQEGFWYPIIDNDKCIHCNKCRTICPMDKHTTQKLVDENQVYAVFSKDEEILKRSTSGGAFTHFSNAILEKKGIIFGHTYSDDCKYVYCTSAENTTERNKFCGSKYVQSDMVSIYEKIVLLVKLGKDVLVTGTPCQIAAVNRLFEDKPHNLYTIDIVCHGVPSPGIFSEYIASIEKSTKKKIVNFRFRDKSFGWNKPNRVIEFNDHTYLSGPLSKDAYNFLFLVTDCILRPSCYSCPYAGTIRVSDISIADFWGIDTVNMKMFNNNKGCSLVLLNSEKGKTLKKEILSKITYAQLTLDVAQENNTPLCHPSITSKYRKSFFRNYRILGLKSGVNILKLYNFIYRVKNRIVRLFKRVCRVH